MLYYLMHKDDKVCILDMSADGILEERGRNYVQELLPLPAQKDIYFLRDWLYARAISRARHGINRTLAKLKLPNTNSLLLQNLGLSLVDCYWLCPVDADFTWRDVNMFSNDFNDLLYEISDDSMKEIRNTRFSPNASLQGELQKKWVIDSAGRRVLLKGNYGNNWQQSLNEKFATEINERQPKSFPYVEYDLLKTVFENEDAIICKSYNFITSDKEEFIPLWDIYSSVKNPGYESLYQTCVRACTMLGLEADYVRDFLSYQIELDFIISNTDRHFNNIGLIRDSETLKFKRFAPIYDCGNSLFWNKKFVPKTKSDLRQIRTTSFSKRESNMLKYIKTPLFDCSKLPSREVFESIYSQDPDITEERRDSLYQTLLWKSELLEESRYGSVKSLHSF